MSQKYLTALVLCIVVCCAAFAGCIGSDSKNPAQTDAEEKPTYIVGIDAPYPPFSIMGKDGNPTGFDTDTMLWIAEKEGFNVKFQQIAFDSLIPALNGGKIDLVHSGMTITPDRMEQVNFSIPYWTVNQTVIVREGSTLTMDDVLAGKATIGTQTGTTADIWIDKNLVQKGLMDKKNLKHHTNIANAVTDLENGNIDAVMFDSTVINDVIAGKKLQKIGTIDTGENFGIAVRKGDDKLLAMIDDGLEKFMNDPYREELIQKYHME
ncbi:basic amino acid ABC transporter substrate-binding protein [uncultured Methanofollis sp.]|uniref:basic amino acid ABC transporter substrate-binding protein n=1 Tax=uncultured Methanofollis sp. TaxID=262500 RepID=UPI00261D81C6|nr:basic amino acid ABC transporter substrate-binding protein [uncultured Methanofollis sp.]